MEQQKRDLQFKISIEGKPEKPFDIVLYAFDANGKLITSAPAKGGQAQLSLSDENAREARLLLAPPQAQERQMTPESLLRLGAYEATFTFDPAHRAYDLLPVPEAAWRLWPLCI